MAFILRLKKLRALGIDLTGSQPVWVLLEKNRRGRLCILRHSDDNQRPPRCRHVYTAIGHQHLLIKPFTLTQPLTDEQIMLQLQLCAHDLFGLPWSMLAIDFYRSTPQQLNVFAARQTLITDILQQLARDHLHAMVIEPTNQALTRIGHFHQLGNSHTLLMYLNHEDFYLLFFNPHGVNTHYALWPSIPTNPPSLAALQTAITAYHHHKKIVMTGPLASQLLAPLQHYLDTAVTLFDPLTQCDRFPTDNPGQFMLALALALRGGMIDD